MPPADAAPLLEADGLACRRAGRLLLEAVDWRLAPGDALLLKGANGSGKSSLLRLLAGFLRPAGGTLRHAGGDAFADLPRYRQALHHIAWQDALKPGLTVAENLGFVAALLGAGADRVRPALAAFGVAELAATPARFLSSGQRRRVALARLAAVPRPIWLLDEPGVGLDRPSRDRLEALLAEHRRTGGVAVVASHGDVDLDGPYVLDLGG